MNFAETFIDAYNVVVGTIVAILSYVLGEHWILLWHSCCSTWQIG